MAWIWFSLKWKACSIKWKVSSLKQKWCVIHASELYLSFPNCLPLLLAVCLNHWKKLYNVTPMYQSAVFLEQYKKIGLGSIVLYEISPGIDVVPILIRSSTLRSHVYIRFHSSDVIHKLCISCSCSLKRKSIRIHFSECSAAVVVSRRRAMHQRCHLRWRSLCLSGWTPDC